jgi:hypothetical protein
MGEPPDVNEKPLCKILEKWKSIVRMVYFLQHGTNRREIPRCARNDDPRPNREKKKKKKEGRKNTEP